MALPATSVFEVRGGAGSDNNGGGFDPSKSGTDYSQQNAAQFSGTDLTSVSSLVVSSVSHNFVSTDVGNFINITAGTGFTVGIYEIVSVSANQATLDRSPGTVGVSGTWAEGGALATIGKVIGVWASGNIAWVKASASYVLTAALTIGSGGQGNGSPNYINGYTTTRGDGGQATLTTSTNSINLVSFASVSYVTFQNFIFSSTAGTPGYGWQSTTGTCLNITAVNCKWTGFSVGIEGDFGAFLYDFQFLILLNCVITACTTFGVVNSLSSTLVNCTIYGNGSDGYKNGSGSGKSGIMTAINCIFKGNGGNGVTINSGSFGATLINCSVTSNTGDGIACAYQGILSAWNNIFDANGAWGIAITGLTSSPSALIEMYNAFYANTSGKITGFTGSTTDITLTGSPYVSIASNNFALNSTAGAGAACRNAGIPGVLQVGGTGYADIGALRHQDPAGGSTYLGGSSAGMSSIIAM